jgi:hypothetical protein
MTDLFTEEEKVAVIMEPQARQRIRRLSDGAMFEASHPGFADYSSLFGAGPTWFFRRIEKLPRKWWWKVDRWKRTGEVWETTDNKDWTNFNVDLEG